MVFKHIKEMYKNTQKVEMVNKFKNNKPLI